MTTLTQSANSITSTNSIDKTFSFDPNMTTADYVANENNEIDTVRVNTMMSVNQKDMIPSDTIPVSQSSVLDSNFLQNTSSSPVNQNITNAINDESQSQTNIPQTDHIHDSNSSQNITTNNATGSNAIIPNDCHDSDNDNRKHPPVLVNVGEIPISNTTENIHDNVNKNIPIQSSELKPQNTDLLNSSIPSKFVSGKNAVKIVTTTVVQKTAVGIENASQISNAKAATTTITITNTTPAVQLSSYHSDAYSSLPQTPVEYKRSSTMFPTLVNANPLSKQQLKTSVNVSRQTSAIVTSNFRSNSADALDVPSNSFDSASRHSAGPFSPRKSLGNNIPAKKQKSEKEVLVGTPVKEGHVNYMLMYDMLTGIRISVSRCTAKPARPLEPSDYSAAHKIAFDITGNEMVPTSKYDFKFKDYAPYVFRIVRECFHVDAADYLTSLTGKYVLSELGSPGKSGSFFYFSQDYRFIIKTIHHYEHRFLLKILPNYVAHINANPNTLISRIFGLHRVKLPGNRKIHFVVMGNVFPANKDIHEIYDLKGSLAGRMFPEKEAVNNPRAVLKDKNWIARGRQLMLGPEKARIFVDQIQKDVEFLKSQMIMDYSLLIGIHDMIKGNKENIRDQTLSVYEPDHEVIARAASTTKPRKRVSKSTAIKKMLSESEAVALGPSSSKLPEVPPEERRHVLFYQDSGGFQATSSANNSLPIIYYLGIIDIFTKYNFTKRVETFFKSAQTSRKKISSVHPNLYGNRFVKFIDKILSPPDLLLEADFKSRLDQDTDIDEEEIVTLSQQNRIK